MSSSVVLNADSILEPCRFRIGVINRKRNKIDDRRIEKEIARVKNRMFFSKTITKQQAAKNLNDQNFWGWMSEAHRSELKALRDIVKLCVAAISHGDGTINLAPSLAQWIPKVE